MWFFVEKEEWLVNCKFATCTKALTHINKQRNFAKSTVNVRAQGTSYHKAGRQHGHFTRRGGSAHHKTARAKHISSQNTYKQKHLPHGISMSAAGKIKTVSQNPWLCRICHLFEFCVFALWQSPKSCKGSSQCHVEVLDPPGVLSRSLWCNSCVEQACSTLARHYF